MHRSDVIPTGYQVWDVDGIEREIVAGVTGAGAMSQLEGEGVDGWSV